MVVHGRLTVFGEYLMHRHAEGYVVPTRQRLASPDETTVCAHPRYDPRLDSVARRLREMGLPTHPGIRGDLPLGFGFASSTALAVLHLSLTGRDHRAPVDEADRSVHGFPPSGMDFESVKRQEAGFFGPAGWRDADRVPLLCSAFVPPDRLAMSFHEVWRRVVDRADDLTRLVAHLTRGVETAGELDRDALFDYSALLATLGVYSRSAQDVVALLLSRGVPAKATGGLRNKAVIAFWRDEAERTTSLAALLRHHPEAESGLIAEVS